MDKFVRVYGKLRILRLSSMNHLCKISLTCFILNTSCARHEPNMPSSKIDLLQNTVLNIDTSTIAILEIDQWLAKRLSSIKSFNLTNADIKSINEIFIKCVLKNNIDISSFRYRRQYVSFIDNTGHKKVWINCFCLTTYDDLNYWRKSPVIVEDGGRCFFNFIVDLTDNSFSDFEVNGDA